MSDITTPKTFTKTKRFDIYSSDTKVEVSHICWMLQIPYKGWPYLPDTSGVSNAFYHIMLMVLFNRAYLNAPTSFGVLPCLLPKAISRQVTKMVIGEGGFYLKKTTAETGVDFIWVDFGTNIFMVWGENQHCVYNALSAIQWRINKYSKIVENANENLLVNDNGANIPTAELGVNDVLTHENGDDSFVHVPEHVSHIAVNPVNSECVLNPIWTKDDSNVDIVDSDGGPISINDHESDTMAAEMGGDMNGLVSMLMNLLSVNSSKQ